MFFLLIPFSVIALSTCIVMGGPARYSMAATALGLLLLFGWLKIGWWAGALWFGLYGGLRVGLTLDYQRRMVGTERGLKGHSRYLSFLPGEPGRRGLALWLTPLKLPLFWLVHRLKGPLPGAGPAPAGTLLAPLLSQIFGESRGFKLDTRHVAGMTGRAMEIRCD